MTVATDPGVRIIKQRRARSPRIVLRTTPQIIDRALPRDSGHCVWADALQEAVPHAKNVSVDLATIRFTDPAKGCRYTYLTPRAVQVDLVNFDQGVKPQPLTISLRGGQVTKAGQSKVKRVKGETIPPIPNRTILGNRQSSGNVPQRVGGKTPPLGAFAHTGGRRREFGLRGLGRVAEEPQT